MNIKINIEGIICDQRVGKERLLEKWEKSKASAEIGQVRNCLQ